MKLNEAVNLLKEIVEDCPSFEGSDFVIGTSKSEHSKAEGYEIHITGQMDDAKKKYLSNLAIEKKLAIHQTPNSVLIYRTKAEASK